MRNSFRKNKDGFVLFISVLVFATILLVVAVLGSIMILQENRSVMISQNKKMATQISAGCMEQTLQKLAMNASYVGNEILLVGTNQCQVGTIVFINNTWRIRTQAIVQTERTRYEVAVSSLTPITLSGWHEIASFP